MDKRENSKSQKDWLNATGLAANLHEELIPLVAGMMAQCLKHLLHKCDGVQIPRTYSNARWVWWPTYKSSLGEIWELQKKLASKTSQITEIWVWLRDSASTNKVGDRWRMMPNIKLGASHACAHKCTHTQICIHTHAHHIHLEVEKGKHTASLLLWM